MRFETNRLREQLKALQAIDVDLTFKHGGKVIVICRIFGNDIVKIIDVKPEWKMTEYQDLVRQIEAEFGARGVWVDAGPGGTGAHIKRIILDERNY